MNHISRERITSFFSDFEGKYKVDTFTYMGERIWPVVRIVLAQAMHAGIFEWVSKTPPCQEVTVRKRINYYSYLNKIHYLASASIKNIKSTNLYRIKTVRDGLLSKKGRDVENGEVVIISNINRRARFGERNYNTVVGPFIELLAQEGIRYVLWERGQKQDATFYSPCWYDEGVKLGHGIVPKQFKASKIKPVWFRYIVDSMETQLGVFTYWGYLEENLRKILCFRSVARDWLKKTNAKLLVTDCWYNVDCMAFLAAANDLNMTTLDYQHGLQGEGHYGYDGWQNIFASEYGFLPSYFWVWGEDDANHLINGGFGDLKPKDIFVGGNLWLNKWQNNDDDITHHHNKKCRDLFEGQSIKIIVTLQKGVDNWDLLKTIIKQGAPNWFWLIRAHRNDSARLMEIEKSFMETGHSGIDVVNATELPLYNIFRICQFHITGFSTCAIEALAFGVPTFLTHESGKLAFKKLLNDEQMYYSQNPNEIVQLMDKSLNERMENPIDTVNYFASSHKSPLILKQLLGY